MQGNRHKGGHGFFVVGMGMKFDAIGKDPPHVQANIACVLVQAATNPATHVAQIHSMCHNARVGLGELK